MSELVKLKGIYLHHVKYSESSVIAKIYTDQAGMQSFMIRGMSKSKKNKKSGLLQPLTLLELVAYLNPKKDLHHIKEINPAYHFKSLQQSDMLKSTLSIFINELVYKSIREQEQNLALFHFLDQSIRSLDTTKEYMNFHLVFAIQLTKYLGIKPENKPEQATFFDLREGTFSIAPPLHPDYIEGSLTADFKNLLRAELSTASSLNLNTFRRRQLLDVVIAYYHFHLQGFGEIKSKQILETVLA